MNALRRIARLALLALLGFSVAGCCWIPPRGYGYGYYGHGGYNDGPHRRGP